MWLHKCLLPDCSFYRIHSARSDSLADHAAYCICTGNQGVISLKIPSPELTRNSAPGFRGTCFSGSLCNFKPGNESMVAEPCFRFVDCWICPVRQAESWTPGTLLDCGPPFPFFGLGLVQQWKLELAASPCNHLPGIVESRAENDSAVHGAKPWGLPLGDDCRRDINAELTQVEAQLEELWRQHAALRAAYRDLSEFADDLRRRLNGCDDDSPQELPSASSDSTPPAS